METSDAGPSVARCSRSGPFDQTPARPARPDRARRGDPLRRRLARGSGAEGVAVVDAFARAPPGAAALDRRRKRAARARRTAPARAASGHAAELPLLSLCPPDAADAGGGRDEICRVCRWADDGTDGTGPFSPNHGITLIEARANAARHLLTHGPEDAPRFAERGGADPVLRSLRIGIRDAADCCRGRPDGPASDLAGAALADAIERSTATPARTSPAGAPPSSAARRRLRRLTSRYSRRRRRSRCRSGSSSRRRPGTGPPRRSPRAARPGAAGSSRARP